MAIILCESKKKKQGGAVGATGVYGGVGVSGGRGASLADAG